MAYLWLCERLAVNWSRSHFETFPKCDLLLNNLRESFNSSILLARDKSIITMLEKIRVMLMERLYKMRDAMKSANHHIFPKIVKLIKKMKNGAAGWIEKWGGDDLFEVVGPHGELYIVDLQKRTCGCRRWDLSGLPCTHAIAAIKFLNVDPLLYVHDCYSVKTYLRTYGSCFGPINGRALWPITIIHVLLPPDVKKRPGRPKKTRRREPNEPANPSKFSKRRVKMRCTNCGTVGHNKRGCKQRATTVSAQVGATGAQAGASGAQGGATGTKACASGVQSEGDQSSIAKITGAQSSGNPKPN